MMILFDQKCWDLDQDSQEKVYNNDSIYSLIIDEILGIDMNNKYIYDI